MRTPGEIFERAVLIQKERLVECSGDSYAALLSLVGSVAVADLLIDDYGSKDLALKYACYDAAEKEDGP